MKGKKITPQPVHTPPKQSVPRRSLSQKQFERLVYIHKALQRATYPTQPKIADVFGVSAKTIQSDFKILRQELEFPIEFDHLRQGFYYTRPCLFLGEALTKQELGQLYEMSDLMHMMMGTDKELVARSAFEKLKENFGFGPAEGIELGRRWISFRPFAPDKVDSRNFAVVDKGLREHCEIMFWYRNLHAKEAKHRKVKPIALVALPGSPYLIGWCYLANDYRVFQLKRMRLAEVTKVKFEPVADFNVDEFMGDAFKMWHGKGEFKVHLTLDAHQADIDGDRQWPKSWKYIEKPDGTAEMHITVSNLDEFETFVLERGRHVTVHGPTKLIEQLLVHYEESAAKCRAALKRN